MLKAGTYLNERYEIVRKIGKGGMADVYRGKDHKLRRYVAIKVLKPEFGEDHSFIRKFQIEAQAAAGILHPNVVNVYDVGEDLGLNYMVMELVDGITLKEYIQKKGKLGDKEVISIAIQMASGLDAAHKRNIVHRDIKPQNVMISQEGKVKVTDFGIAKPSAAENTVSTNVMGSVHYTSPEQARGGSCDAQSDIYSLGITLYEMITGTIPFDGESPVAIAVKHLQEEMIAPSEYEPEMYYSLERIILKCTQKNASKRYVNMEALILDLKRALVDPDGDFVDLDGFVYSGGAQRTSTKVTRMDDDDDDDDEYDEYDDDDDDDDDEYGRGTRRRNNEAVDPKMQNIVKILTIVVAVILAFSLLFIAGRAVGFFSFGSGDEVIEEDGTVKVPSLLGLTEEEAIEALEEKGLDYSIIGYEESPKYEKGLVILQDIEAGTEVDSDTEIKITISSGITEDTVKVPDVEGLSEADAQKALNDADLTMTSTTAYDPEVKQGLIISMSPGAGTEVATKSTVVVVVSMGEEPPAKTLVPDLKGKTAAQAVAELEAVNLKSSATEEYSDTVAAGKIISQDLKAGKEVDEGTTVSFVVSKGPEKIMVKMPTVVGKSEEEAVYMLESADYGFTVKVTEQYSNSVTAGFVMSSNISAGTSVEKGTATSVTLVVSLGPEAPPTTGGEGSGGGTNPPDESTGE